MKRLNTMRRRSRSFVHCVANMGGGGSWFTAGKFYEIVRVIDENHAILKCNRGNEFEMIIGNTQFEWVDDCPILPAPEFDLDDMELAEIIMEECK